MVQVTNIFTLSEFVGDESEVNDPYGGDKQDLFEYL